MTTKESLLCKALIKNEEETFSDKQNWENILSLDLSFFQAEIKWC